MFRRNLFIVLAITFAFLTLTSSTSARSQSCTPTITHQDLSNWSAEYSGLVLPGDDANTAFNKWIATERRTIPELACVPRPAMAQVYNMINIWLSSDSGSAFRSQSAPINFFNDLVTTNGSAFMVRPQWIFYSNGSSLRKDAFAG